ncbi:TPA: restriction endonuclease subunit S [Acinetobacter baumannii]|uniref:restriction endonuclease subunit S n=1 Tax=Acinetobacter baumannii TaxID=470 RepID=UPI001EE84B58|nr:restriction endonuclease subunit S [Acinetobacter baumannii]MCG5957862.1 restriction endonuclease subunit S [Acinetobacter baumannii]HAV5325833.1 restriction endonuclease subunit S [Acinetobacter baumannii]
MSDWKKIPFNQVASFSYGKMPKKDLLGKGEFQTFSGYKYLDKYPEYNCDIGDLIVVARGVGGSGDVKLVNRKCYLTNLSIKFDLDHKTVFTPYLYYYFQWNNLRYLDSGSAQSQITINDLSKVELSLPPLPEQKAIASVLSSLDDKIDLLHRQNKTLEAMAETLFRQWFIEEAKEDWEDADLTQLITLQSGYAFKSKDFQDSGNFGVIKIKNISGNIIDIEKTDFVSDDVGLATAQRFYVLSGQVLIAMTGAEIGKLGLVPKTSKKLLLNQRVGLLKPNFEGAEYLAYLHLKSEFGQDYIENSATGSAQPNISGSLIEACPFPKLENSFLQQCGQQVQVYYSKVKENLKQIQTLEKLRDTLLPKLMSGEVRVNLSH